MTQKNNEIVRLFALGGLDEDGKNMMIVQIDKDIYILEAGLKFPDPKQSLGVEYIVQDFSWLVEHEDDIKAIFITHGHDDVMGALPYLLKQIKADIYASEFTAGQIAKLLKDNQIHNAKIKIVKNRDYKQIGGRQVLFFPLTHSYPQAYGLAIRSSYGFIVYTGEFIQDYDQVHESYKSDYHIADKLKNDGVLILMQDSKGADRSGHTSPGHRLNEKFDEVLSHNDHKRIFVATYTQSVYWIQEIIQGCIDNHRKICFYNKELQELIAGLESITEAVPFDLVISHEEIDKYDNCVVLISGQGKSLFKHMSNIANNESKINFSEDDIIVVAAPLIPGVEKSFRDMENDIYKHGGLIIKLDDGVVGMHPAREDLKMMISMTDPKYYIPIKGEYRMLCANAMVAEEMGIPTDQILILDNYQVAEFENGQLMSVQKILDLHETYIDGKEDWDMAGVVLKDREILSKDGVIVLAVGLDEKTHQIINGPDIQTRGLVYLRDAEHITTDVADIMEEVVDEMKDKPDFDANECRSLIRERVARYLYKKTGKRPMVLPVILELNLN